MAKNIASRDLEICKCMSNNLHFLCTKNSNRIHQERRIHQESTKRIQKKITGSGRPPNPGVYPHLGVYCPFSCTPHHPSWFIPHHPSLSKRGGKCRSCPDRVPSRRCQAPPKFISGLLSRHDGPLAEEATFRAGGGGNPL